jgi:hypothetical protein
MYIETKDERVFLNKYWKDSTINTDQNPLKLFNFFVKNAYLTPPLKKIINFTRISRTVWTFAKKTEISQNTENFHPYVTCQKKKSKISNTEITLYCIHWSILIVLY